MAFDYKKEYPEYYRPPNRPELVALPRMNYVVVEGKGDPNRPEGAYQRALDILYSVSYTLKMSDKTGHQIEGFFPYVVPPLEGFWWFEDGGAFDCTRKDAFCWISAIRLPDFVTERDLEWAVETAARKKKLDCAPAEFRTVEEGLCVQMLHLGSYDDEPASLARMRAYLEGQGCQLDLSARRLHHEIYLSDPRRTAPERRKTVLRLPVRRLAD